MCRRRIFDKDDRNNRWNWFWWKKSNIFKNPQVKNIETKYGKPSSPITIGTINDKSVALLSRHGHEHTITPSHVNNRANIEALKLLGCKNIIATTACGSLREEMHQEILLS